jgi:hypothetical protein
MEKKISIITRRTGYEFNIGKDSYFYRDEDELLRGVVHHLAMGIKEPQTQEYMAALIEAALLYRADKGATVKRIYEANKETEKMRNLIKKQKKKIIQLYNHLSYYNKKFAQNIDIDDEEE